MQELDIATVTKRSIHGVFALVSRSFVIQIISFLAGNIVLPLYLSPSVFGVFAVVSAIRSFLTYFSDIGLAAALIQKKEPITERELKTTFTIQQILVGTVVLIALLTSPQIGSFYRLSPEATLLFQALVISFFLSSLKTIPSVILERNLRFDKLIIPQIIETIFYFGIAVILAIRGFGISSFTYAVLAQSISGLLAIYFIAPWKIGFSFSKEVAKRLLSFGIPFQTNSFLALLKDDLLIVYLGRVLSFQEVGYISLSQRWAYAPLRLVMDNIIRITFPSFSRLQHDKNALRVAVEKSLFISTFFIFPALMGLSILFPYLIHLIPKYEQKWSPVLFSLYFFAINASLSSVSTPLTNVLNAIGKVRYTLYLMVFWLFATWTCTLLFIHVFGFNGVSIASAFVSISVILVIYLVKRLIDFNVLESIGYQLISTIIMGGILYILSPIIINNLIMLVIMVFVGLFMYIGMMFIVAKHKILSDIKLLFENIRN